MGSSAHHHVALKLGYSGVIVLLSAIGAVLPLVCRRQLLKRPLLLKSAFAFSAGVFLGVSVLDVIPDAVSTQDDLQGDTKFPFVFGFVLLGVLLNVLLEGKWI